MIRYCALTSAKSLISGFRQLSHGLTNEDRLPSTQCTGFSVASRALVMLVLRWNCQSASQHSGGFGVEIETLKLKRLERHQLHTGRLPSEESEQSQRERWCLVGVVSKSAGCQELNFAVQPRPLTAFGFSRWRTSLPTRTKLHWQS